MHDTPRFWTTLWAYWGSLDWDHRDKEFDAQNRIPGTYNPLYWKYDPGSYGVYGAEMQNLSTSQSQKTLTDDIVWWLDRAKGQPLSLYFDLSPNTQRDELKAILRRYAASTRVLHLKGPLDMVHTLSVLTSPQPEVQPPTIPTRSIWQVLRNAKSHKAEGHDLNKAEGHDLTSLEELKLVVPSYQASCWFLAKHLSYSNGKRKEGPDTDSIIIDLSGCKALRSFSVVNESPYALFLYDAGWLMRPKLITGVPYAQLTSLHIVEQVMNQSFALSILRESKNLRTVILRQISWKAYERKRSNGAQEQIHLAFLETLDLSFSIQKEADHTLYFPPDVETASDSPDFIGQLETPALQNLSLAWDCDGPNIRVFQIIAQMLQLDGVLSLRALRLYGVRSDANILMRFLEGLPMLHVVEIASPRLATKRRDYGAIMECLSDPTRAPVLPHLKELTIWDNIEPFRYKDEISFPWHDGPHDAKDLDMLCQDFSRAITLIQKRNISDPTSSPSYNGQLNVASALLRVKLVFWVYNGYCNPGSPDRMDLEERLDRLKQSSNDITPELVLHPMRYVPAWEPDWPSKHWHRVQTGYEYT
ncbi:hypothetical protein H0H92_007962 [Tricholoma furcatifolium]|nr:hypothetical protein H0H92_007962 [Tricholoma furcatifolium]